MPTNNSGQQARLETGLAALGVASSQQQSALLLEYLDLLQQWNRTYNLVASGDLSCLLTRHVLDSLAINEYVVGDRLLDVGSGAGFPGIPLAVLNPGMECVLLDGAGKKIRFLNHVVRRLKLNNVNPVNERLEHFSPGQEFSTITARAFASLEQFATGARHLSGPRTRLLAMKGKRPTAELENLPEGIELEAIHRLEVPGLQAERHLVVMSVRVE